VPHEVTSFPRLLSPEQVGQIYGVDSKTVSRWADEGRLKHIRTPGGHRRFFEDDIREKIQSASGVTDREEEEGEESHEH
jgi:excisionase family DNA binding protein